MPGSFKKLQELGAEVVDQVETRLLNGETPASIARWLQEDLQVLQDLKLSSVKKNLERYRANDLKNRVITEIAERHVGKSVSGLKKKLLATEEMETLAAIQKDRVEKLLRKEAKLPEGIVLKTTSDEIRLFKETLTELGKLQLETGTIRRAPKTLSGTMSDPATGETRAFTWTEEQARLMEQLEDVTYEEIEDAQTTD